MAEQKLDDESEKEIHGHNTSSMGIKFGQFLLIASIIVFLIPNIFTSLTPNGYEIIAWMGWAMALFVLGIIIIVITYLLGKISGSR
jgi:isoprenylcysteine carboxyl methyltransferase (ICMT) family protein YpbQ